MLRKSANIVLIKGNYYGKSNASCIIETLQNSLCHQYRANWYASINSVTGVLSGNNGNKLRKYKLFKREYKTEHYVHWFILQKHPRSAFAKFRCGVAPLKIETGRYQSMPINERTCFNCVDQIEDEIHVLINCPLYNNTRSELFSKVVDLNANFSKYTVSEKFDFLLSNEKVVKYSAKACHDILLERRHYLYS